MVWLKEPYRLGPVAKWSGTNQHPTHSQNKLGNILNAFAHFIYDASYKSVVLADIQISQVLFDLTNHTSTGASGVGDHGQDGIDIFVEQHQCSNRCKMLGLTPLQGEDEDGNNGVDDN
ncbi:kinase-like domain-containing protein [Mycena pura]|uniref:Kinase-like domain-containing protein n=1 Tax=Mycena pura TaxID=153505 RepID=A0AAD6YIH3_9AGAR|nr:kinase-like domain-containing protein [Mycena pura]